MTTPRRAAALPLAACGSGTGAPERVVIPGDALLGHVVPLGVKPVGTASHDEERLGDKALSQGLPAVREARSFTVETDVWSSRSIVGAGLVPDDIDRILVEPPGK